jgi:hypothetical protein
MSRPLQRRLVAALLPFALIGAGLGVSPSPASADDTAPETGPLRVVNAATSDRVEVFAGDLSTMAEFGGGATRPDPAVLSAAYDAAQQHPDDLAPPYAEGTKVVTPAATSTGVKLLTKAADLGVPDGQARYSIAALQRIEYAIGDLKGAPFDSAQIGFAYLQASKNRVVVDAVTASDELRQALAARFGADAVAVHLVAPMSITEQDDGRYNDAGNFEGGSEIGASPGVAGTCTSGFAWSASGYGDMMGHGRALHHGRKHRLRPERGHRECPGRLVGEQQRQRADRRGLPRRHVGLRDRRRPGLDAARSRGGDRRGRRAGRRRTGPGRLSRPLHRDDPEPHAVQGVVRRQRPGELPGGDPVRRHGRGEVDVRPWKWHGDRTGSYAACPGGLNVMNHHEIQYS